MEFYIWQRCGNLITCLDNKGVPVMCCGQKMTQLGPGTVDASREKHVPVVETAGSPATVTVGPVEHPTLPEHFIPWIALETNQGSQIKYLQPGQAPKASFALAEGEEVKAVYEYCNLHGLWVASI